MKSMKGMVVLFAIGVAWSAWAADKPVTNVEVSFINAENFTDVKEEYMDSGRGRDRVLDEMKKHIIWSASRCIAADRKLEIKVTDIDLAGDFEPWRSPQLMDVRILRDIYPPRISLEFRLLDAQGKVVSEGKRELQDHTYLMMSAMPSHDGLRYDKQLISDWLRREFKTRS